MMIVAFVALMAAPIDTAAKAPRTAFAECLKQALAEARTQKVAADAFDAFARTQCATTEDALKKAVMAIDVRNGIARKDAADNARQEMDDYYVTARDHLAQ
jgi:hypothetical protein